MDHRLLDVTTRQEVIAQESDSPAVLLNTGVLSPFLDDAEVQYRLSLSSARDSSGNQHFPRSFALLVGRESDSELRVTRLAFSPNIRAEGGVARREFDEVIVPRFGRVYENQGRGYWCDGRTLLRVYAEAEAQGLALLGSIHLHPDWHRIGPQHERWMRMSEHPTPTDEHLFRNTGWPLNIICYAQRLDGRLAYTLAAWAPPDRVGPAAPCRELQIMPGAAAADGRSQRYRSRLTSPADGSGVARMIVIAGSEAAKR